MIKYLTWIVLTGLSLTTADAAQARQGATARVTGTVTYLQRIALPPNAEVTVQLADVSLADAPARVITEQTFITNGRQVPFPFELAYDPATIDPRFTYAVQAAIRVDGQLRFINTQSYPVITNGNPTNVDVLVEPVSEGNGGTGPLPTTGAGDGGRPFALFMGLALLAAGLLVRRRVARSSALQA